MKQINLSEIMEDSCCKSLTMSLRSMYCVEMKPQKNQAIQFLSKYLPEYRDVLSAYLGQKHEDYVFVTDKILEKRERLRREYSNKIINDEDIDENLLEVLIDEERALRYTNLFNSGIYNLATLLSIIDKCIQSDDELLYENSIGKYKTGENILTEKTNMLCLVHLGVSTFVIEADQNKGLFQWNKHYNVASNMHQIMANHRRYECGKAFWVEKCPEILLERDGFLSDMLLMIDLYRVRKQCILEKIMIAFIYVFRSPEYDEGIRQYAHTLVSLLNEIMVCGEIHKLYLQEGYYNVYSGTEKTSNDATTRMSIIFSTKNEDIYIVRIDLPHKGQEFFHINMEEVVGEKILPVGYPITYDMLKNLDLNLDQELFDDLFFEMNDRVWFRTEFGKNVKRKVIDPQLRQQLENLFHQQSHISITVEDNCINQVTFMEEVKVYLKRMSITESACFSFGKMDIAYAREIKKIRGLFEMELALMRCMAVEHKDYRIRFQDMIYLFEKYFDISMHDAKSKKISSIFEINEIFEEIMK